MALVIAIDIGNTNTRLGCVETETLTCVNHASFSALSTVDTVINAVETMAASYSFSNTLPITICSVRKTFGTELLKALAERTTIKPAYLHYHKALPLRIHYDKPETLGADRIANCLYGAARCKNQPCVIIDAGTAITTEVVSAASEFIGGYIIPGITMQLQSMHQNTAALPAVTRIDTLSHGLPQSTLSAMHNGVLLSIAGGVSRIIHTVVENLGPEITILTCGGAWKTIASLVDFSYEYVPALTLIGVGLYNE